MGRQVHPCSRVFTRARRAVVGFIGITGARLGVVGFIRVRVGSFRHSYWSSGSFGNEWVHSGASRCLGVVGFFRVRVGSVVCA